MKPIIHNIIISIDHDDGGDIIKTPLGVFHDVNDAIEVYPSILNEKRIKKCKNCQEYFIDNSKFNNKKYCSKKCREEYTKELKRMWERDERYKTINKQLIIDDYGHRINPEFNQNDKVWGVGTTFLSEHRNKDFDKELKIVQKELKKILEYKRKEQY